MMAMTILKTAILELVVSVEMIIAVAVMIR